MKKINPHIFKAYDIRGIYPGELDEKTAFLIGKAYTDYIREAEGIEEPQIVVGRDARPSSPRIFNALTKGIVEQGGDVFNIGLSTTPMLYWAVNFLTAQGGIMITASHNPKEYNGFKMTRSKAVIISENQGMEEIKDKVLNQEFKKGETKEAIMDRDVKEYYLNYLLKDVKPSFSGKIAIDAGNGMAGILLPRLLERLQVRYLPLYFELDGNFPNHEANPLKEKTLQKLQETIKKEKADLGVAFDGDGDRVSFLTEKGEIIRGDFIGAILSQALLKDHRGGGVVYDIRCSKILPELVKAKGGKPILSRVGHPYIKKKMAETKAILGVELSCHIYFDFDFPLSKSYFESGLFALISFLDVMAKSGKKSSELLAPLKKYYYSGEINFKLTDKKRALSLIEKKYQKISRIDKQDGIRIDVTRKKDWFWFIVRPSNTEPLLRLIMESNQKELFSKELKKIKALIRSEGGEEV